MATFKTKVYTQARNFAQPEDSDLDWAPVDVDFPATGPAVSDVILLAVIPAGVTLQDYEFQFPQIDSNGAPTWAFSFGVMNAGLTALATTYVSGVTAGRTTAIVENTNTDCAQDATNNALQRTLGMVITAVAATYVPSKTGQVCLQLKG